jgi:hypothetical protein
MVSGVTRDRESARCPVPEIALTITFDDGAEGRAHVLRATNPAVMIRRSAASSGVECRRRLVPFAVPLNSLRHERRTRLSLLHRNRRVA